MNFLSTSHETVASDFSSAHSVSCRLRLQFPFVFRQLHSLQMLGLARPFPFRSPRCLGLLPFISLGFRFHDRLPLPLLFLTPAVFAFFRPLQFWVLTTQPLFLLFGFLHASASQWLLRCSFASFVAPVFPLPFRLISHPFRSIPLTQLRCMFPFALPCFAPTAVSQVLVFFPVSSVTLFPTFVFLCLMLSFVRFRLSRSSYSAFSLFRSASSLTHLAPVSFGAPQLLSLLRFPRFPSSGFPSALFRLCLLGSLPRFLSSFPTSLPQPFRWCLPLFSASFPLLLL